MYKLSKVKVFFAFCMSTSLFAVFFGSLSFSHLCHPTQDCPPMWNSIKDISCLCVGVWVGYVLDCTCTCTCVMRVVMNKDVLCVKLVVNHWQCWQLTDKQIDPRPPRECCLALGHSSYMCTHTRVYPRLSEGWPKGLSSGSFSDRSC